MQYQSWKFAREKETKALAVVVNAGNAGIPDNCVDDRQNRRNRLNIDCLSCDSSNFRCATIPAQDLSHPRVGISIFTLMNIGLRSWMLATIQTAAKKKTEYDRQLDTEGNWRRVESVGDRGRLIRLERQGRVTNGDAYNIMYMYM